MTTQSPLIDAGLRDSQPLRPRTVDPGEFKPLVDHVASSVANRHAPVVEPDEQRDLLLARYRRLFTEQVVHDVSYNVQHLWHWAERLARNTNVFRDGLIHDAFDRLNVHRQFLIDHDQWSTNRAEQACWNAFHQFYCDALDLGDRLLKFENGQVAARLNPPRPRRLELPAVASNRLLQTFANIAEQGLPNFVHFRPLRALLPAALYQGVRALFRWPKFRWLTFLKNARYVITSGGFDSWCRPRPASIERRGVDDFFANPEFFDQSDRSTKHNIILAFSHRHSFLDLCIIAEIFNGLKHAVWTNEEFFPKSATRDPMMVVITPGKGCDLAAALDRTAEIMIDQCRPLLLAVDGGTPYLPYGQQMRIKRGIRSLVDHLHQQSQGTARKTFIVPFSLSDTVSYIRGITSKVMVSFGPPICSEDIAPPIRPANPGLLNWGDPLLNHLECHFLAHTGQVQHGWRTPRVIETTRRAAEERQRAGGVRNWIRGRFHASLYDLSRDQCVPEAEPIGP